MLKKIPFLFLALLVASNTARAQTSPFSSHPASAALQGFFSSPRSAGFQATDLKKGDYLKLIAGNVDFFKQFQRADGAIIDPNEHAEIQYSTPAFALAAAVLVQNAQRKDLLEPATRALSCSLTALLARKAANGHSDFYIPLIMHAHRLLEDQVDEATRSKWAEQLRSIDPTTMYSAAQRGMNWNIVSDSGEFLRRAEGFVPVDKAAAQMDYLEQCLAGHLKHLTKFGMYEDPNAPLAYDIFARIWLEDALVAGAGGQPAYDGKYAAQIRDFLNLGGLSTLLLLSPVGEWPCGGRSAFHNWNEAAVAVICETEANRWAKLQRPEVAGAFKRAARLALQSMMRWQRPTGELWIVKNRADPRERLGFESYSYTSQYNLLPMALLAMAYGQADDGIAETLIPSEAGTYVFDLRETFHKIIAAAGGYYVEIDTGADPHYNATGLQRVHRAGVPFSPLSDSTAAERAYGPTAAGSAKLALTPGLQWKDQSEVQWHSLADFGWAQSKISVKNAELKVLAEGGDRVQFSLDYGVSGDANSVRHVVQNYTISSAGVECTESIRGMAAEMRVCLPALVSDGLEKSTIAINPGSASIVSRGSDLQWTLLGSASSAALELAGPEVPAHNGYVRALVAMVPSETRELQWRITLSQLK
jgi:hypothetical protein